MSRKSTIENIKQELLERYQTLTNTCQGDSGLLKQLSQKSGGDVADFASESTRGEISSQLAEVETQELKKISAALERMEDGSYGKCDGCKHSIPLARLEALPYAAYCITCKSIAEEAGVEPTKIVDWSTLLSGNLSPTQDFPVVGMDYTP